MALTEKGSAALKYVLDYFPAGSFSAKDLSDACGTKVAAATLNAVANNGYITRLGGSPVMYTAIDGLAAIMSSEEEQSKGIDNSTLIKAKKQKNDEFYTRYEDIEAEVMKYRKQFRDKIVYLPCDDPANKKSEFWSFFVNNFDTFGLKKLIATHYDEKGQAYKIWLDEDLNHDGYIDDWDAQQEDLVGNGDFRSPECVDILKECDIVVTNPPFSLFREFVDWIFTAKKQFLIIGNNNAITYKEIFNLIKNNQMWIGYTANKTCSFRVGEGYTYDEKETAKINDGYLYGKVPAITWFTNMPTNKRNEELILTKKYADNPAVYPFYDSCKAIEVSRVVNIPLDYKDVMGVPITFLDKYNPNQFEILGLDDPDLVYPDWRGRGPDLNGKTIYRRVMIRRK